MVLSVHYARFLTGEFGEAFEKGEGREGMLERTDLTPYQFRQTPNILWCGIDAEFKSLFVDDATDMIP